jgi:putative membrane protein
MKRFLIHWLTGALALGATAWVVPGVRIESPLALLVAALVLGFLNAILKPVLVILTLPITILTLGIFYLVLNAVVFALAAVLVPGFEVAGFGAAFLGAVIMSLVSMFIGSMLKEDRRPARR